MNMADAKILGPDGGNLYRRANDMFVKVTSDDTNGAYEVCEERCPPGFASRRHRHTQNHETFFVIVFQQYHSAGWTIIAADCGYTHRIWIECLRITGVLEPFFKLSNRVLMKVLPFECQT